MPKPDFYQIGTYILSAAIIIAVGFFVFNLTQNKVGKAALKIDTANGKANVLINGKEKGETPVYTEEVYVRDLKVEINGSRNSYSTVIRPAIGTLAIVNRDLGVNKDFSSGQNIWFSKIGGDEAYISIISPGNDGIAIVVDGVEMGKTPVRFSTKNLLKENENNIYTLKFKHDNYEDQEAKIEISPGFELHIQTDMFLKPIPTDVDGLAGLPAGINFINFSNVSNPAFANKQDWAKAINYWLQTRGAAVFGNYKVESFAYFIADDGEIYNIDGNVVQPADVTLEDSMYVAYLGSVENSELSDEAKSIIADIISGGNVSATGESVKILPTGIGFLRVRSGPGTGNSEVGQIEVGATFPLLGEQNGWYKINYDGSSEGWISSTYAEKQ